MRRGSADIAHLIRVDFISCFLQIASQGNYIFVAFQFSQFLRGECATKIKNYSQFAWTGQELLKRWPQNTIIFLVPMNIPELAPSDFFSNFVWPPEGAEIIFLKVRILSWKFFWTFILWQKLALGVCESIFCQKMSKNGQKITSEIFLVPSKKS